MRPNSGGQPAAQSAAPVSMIRRGKLSASWSAGSEEAPSNASTARRRGPALPGIGGKAFSKELSAMRWRAWRSAPRGLKWPDLLSLSRRSRCLDTRSSALNEMALNVRRTQAKEPGRRDYQAAKGHPSHLQRPRTLTLGASGPKGRARPCPIEGSGSSQAAPSVEGFTHNQPATSIWK